MEKEEEEEEKKPLEKKILTVFSKLFAATFCDSVNLFFFFFVSTTKHG